MPVIEAMHHDVPVVAFGAGAVAETVGTGGSLLDRRIPKRSRPRWSGAARRRRAPTRWLPPGRARCAELDRRRREPSSSPRSARGDTVKLAVVVPRYGVEVIGGCENAVRELSEWVAKTTDVEVEVLTTTALDATTWAEHFRRDHAEAGVTVHRFPVERGRSTESDTRGARCCDEPGRLRRGAEEWLDLQGPTSPALVDAVAATDADASRFIRISSGPRSPGRRLVAVRRCSIRTRTTSCRCGCRSSSVIRGRAGARVPSECGTPALRTSIRDAARHAITLGLGVGRGDRKSARAVVAPRRPPVPVVCRPGRRRQGHPAPRRVFPRTRSAARATRARHARPGGERPRHTPI